MKKTGILFLSVLVFWWALLQLKSRELVECRNRREVICRLHKKNPGRLGNVVFGISSEWDFRSQRLIGNHQINPIWRVMKKRIEDRSQEAPTVRAIQGAIWQGDLSSLPFWLIQKYRERGLLPVLALSGQHVSALVFSFSLMGRALWKRFGKPWGHSYFLFSRFITPFATGLLFSCATEEPSMIRTFFCAGILLLLQRIPLSVNRAYASTLGLLWFLIFAPQNFRLAGFVLSMGGAIGVHLSQSSFSSKQNVLKAVWLSVWLMSILALLFGKWVGLWVLFQWGMGLLWDQLFLPLYFFVGLVLIVLPQNLGSLVAQGLEYFLNTWLAWEAKSTSFTGVSIYRPWPWEILIFLGWLVALGAWNQRRLSGASK